MRSVILVSVLFLSVATLAYVHADVQISKNLCSYAPRRSITPPEFNADATKAALTKAVGNLDFCADEKITLTPLGAVVTDTTCICQKTDSAERNQKVLDSVGCAQGQTQPHITINISKSITGCVTDSVVISKCAKDPKAAYQAQCKSGGTPDITAGDGSVEIAPTPWTAADLPTLSVPTETEAMTTALTSTGKVTVDQAQRLVTEQPQSVQELITALSNKDQDAAKVAAAKLQIDPSIAANIGRYIIPEPSAGGEQQGSTNPTRTSEVQPGSTGFNTAANGGLAMPKCGGSDLASGIAWSESGCGANVAANSPGARGLHGFMCPSWNSFAQSTGYGQYTCPCTSGGSYIGQCPYINDPAIANAVVNRRYEMYQQSYGATCSSIGKDWNTCAYLMHFFGEAGFQRMVGVYRNDPNTPMTREVVDSIVQPGAYDANRNVFLKATTADGVFAYLNARLNGSDGSNLTGYSSPTGVSVPGGGSYVNTYTSPFAVAGVGVPAQPPVAMSPFANASLLAGLFQQQSQQQQQAIQQQPQQTIAKPPAASVKLAANPSVGRVGDSFVISWQGTAVIPQTCTLTIPGAQPVTVGPEGSQTVKLTKASAYGLIYTCRGIDGTTQIANQTIFVQ